MRRLLIVAVIVMSCWLIYRLVFCPYCDYFGYYPIPSVQDVFANPLEKPLPVTEIHRLGQSELCVEVNIVALSELKPTMDNVNEWQKLDLRTKLRSTSVFIVDNIRKGLGFTNLLNFNSPQLICANIEGLAVGYHVARIEFHDYYEKLHQYTWVFEVTGDDVVPEVTATAVR